RSGNLCMANYKFAMNTITKRPLQYLLTWDMPTLKGVTKPLKPPCSGQFCNSPWTGSTEGSRGGIRHRERGKAGGELNPDPHLTGYRRRVEVPGWRTPCRQERVIDAD